MKLKNIILTFATLVAFVACKKEPPVITGPGGFSGFAQTEMAVSVVPDQITLAEIPIVFTKVHPAGQNTIMQFTVDPASTAQRALQFELPTATIWDDDLLIFSAHAAGNKDGLGGTFPITFYPDKITEPVVLILNAVNSPDEAPVAGCNPQITIRINPAVQ